MSFDVLGDLNWVAAIVAGLAYWMVGAVWFMPAVAGKAWMRSMGIDASAEPPKMTPAMMAGPVVAYILAAIGLAMIAQATGSDTAGEGVVVGLVAGVGLVGAVLAVTAVFDPKKAAPMAWFAITGLYHLIGLVIAGVIVAVWS